jgi:hypothetical protein
MRQPVLRLDLEIPAGAHDPEARENRLSAGYFGFGEAGSPPGGKSISTTRIRLVDAHSTCQPISRAAHAIKGR